MERIPEGYGDSAEIRDARKAALTRRQFSRWMAGSAAGLLAARTAEANPAMETASEAQSRPSDKPERNYEADPRIAELEREHGSPLTPAQRKGLPGQLKDVDDGGAALRKHPLPDGGGEPHIIFTPLHAERDGQKRAEQLTEGESAHG